MSESARHTSAVPATCSVDVPACSAQRSPDSTRTPILEVQMQSDTRDISLKDVEALTDGCSMLGDSSGEASPSGLSAAMAAMLAVCWISE